MIAAHIQRPDLGARVMLYEIDLSRFGLGVIRITPTTDGVGAAISFGGEVYAPHPVSADGFDKTTSGALPRPKFSVANLDNSFTVMVEQNDDLMGGIVKRIRTYERFLDTGEEPDGGVHLPLDIYEIAVKTRHTQKEIQWTLSALIDQEGVTLPGRKITRDYCTHDYRRWDGGGFDYSEASCPYAGAAHFDENDKPVGAAGDRCSKMLSGCRLRFGEGAVLPTRAFPGVARVRAR